MTERLRSGDERFTLDDLRELSAVVAATWAAAAGQDWSVPAGTLEWSCLRTADHAVDCVYAPAFFLASQRNDAYPRVGTDMTIGPQATPALVVESLAIATRILVAVVADSPARTEAIIFQTPHPLTAGPVDFLPRAGVELTLHAHDVAAGLGINFEPPEDLCRHLRDHTRPWPMWTGAWSGLPETDDPWQDLLTGSGRRWP